MIKQLSVVNFIKKYKLFIKKHKRHPKKKHVCNDSNDVGLSKKNDTPPKKKNESCDSLCPVKQPFSPGKKTQVQTLTIDGAEPEAQVRQVQHHNFRRGEDLLQGWGVRWVNGGEHKIVEARQTWGRRKKKKENTSHPTSYDIILKVVFVYPCGNSLAHMDTCIL